MRRSREIVLSVRPARRYVRLCLVWGRHAPSLNPIIAYWSQLLIDGNQIQVSGDALLKVEVSDNEKKETIDIKKITK